MSGFSLYLAVGSIVGLIIILTLYLVSKKLERTPIKDDNEFTLRQNLINEWDNLNEMTGSIKTTIWSIFAISIIAWPFLLAGILKIVWNVKVRKKYK